MAINRLASNHRVREDVFGSITPNVTVQKDVSAPAGEWKPAPWLPVVFTKSNIPAGEDGFVISSGKVVAMDSQGLIVPAGLRAGLVTAFASGASVLTYDSDDFNYKVEDLVTGAPVATASGASYTAHQVCDALLERGLVSSDAMATSGNTITTVDSDVVEIIQAFISQAIGVAAYDVYVWAGDVVDGTQKFLNYGKQHLVQFLTTLQMKVPHRTTQIDAASAFVGGTVVPVVAQSAPGVMPEAGEIWHETALDDVTRWASAVDGRNVYALKLDQDFVAKNTTRTPITCDVSGIIEDEKTRIEDISSAGDWWLDEDAGVIFIHGTAYDTQVTGTVTFTFTYSFYAVTGSTGSASDRYVFYDGASVPGAFVSYDSQSNFVIMGSAQDALGTSNVRSIGRLHRIHQENRGLLGTVKTAFNLAGMTAVSQMPGSATGGYSDLITLPSIQGDNAADQLAIITLKVN